MTLQLVATGLFLITVLAIVALAIGAALPARRRLVALGLMGWLALSGGLAASGALSNFAAMPPRIAPLLLVATGAAAWVALGPRGARLATQTPLAWLVGFQVFRVAVELTLALLERAGVVPVQMTFEGANWDILTGLTALPVAWLAARDRLTPAMLLLWNTLGLGLLLTIVTIALLSMPTPLRVFFAEPANTFITTLPFVWLPALLVPAALCGHLLIFRRLWANRRVALAIP